MEVESSNIFSGSDYISPINDPFQKSYIECINLSAIRSFDKKKFIIYGSVEFTNGDTTGKQKFNANSLPELFIKIKEFIEQL